MPTALTIGGSDSSAGAGIQADLKTFAAFGVYGTCAITAVTAQSTKGVESVVALSADFVTAQIEAVASRAHQLHLRRVGQAGAPHARTRREDLKRVGAELGSFDCRPLQSAGCERVDA